MCCHCQSSTFHQRYQFTVHVTSMPLAGHLDHVLFSEAERNNLLEFFKSTSAVKELRERMTKEPFNRELRAQMVAKVKEASTVHGAVKAKYEERSKLSPIFISLLDDPSMPPLSKSSVCIRVWCTRTCTFTHRVVVCRAERICDIRDLPNHGCLPQEFCKRDFVFFPSLQDQFARVPFSPYGVCVPRFKSPRLANGLPCLTHSDCASAYCSHRKIHYVDIETGERMVISAGV